MDDRLVPDPGVAEMIDQRPAGDGQRRGIEQVLDLAQDRQQAAGAVQVLHQVAAGRLEIDQQRHPAPDRIEVLAFWHASRQDRPIR